MNLKVRVVTTDVILFLILNIYLFNTSMFVSSDEGEMKTLIKNLLL